MQINIGPSQNMWPNFNFHIVVHSQICLWQGIRQGLKVCPGVSDAAWDVENWLSTWFLEFSDAAVCQSRPSMDGFARLDGHLGKIARLTPVFYQFCPSFCDLVHVQSVSELLSKLNHVATRLCTFNKWFLLIIFNFDALPNQCSQEKSCESNLRAFFKNKNLNFARLCPSLRPSNARIFVKKMPVFFQIWARLKNLAHCFIIILFLIGTTISIVLNLVVSEWEVSNGVMVTGCFQVQSEVTGWGLGFSDFVAIFQGFLRCFQLAGSNPIHDENDCPRDISHQSLLINHHLLT